jgi:hypothetical protein
MEKMTMAKMATSLRSAKSEAQIIELPRDHYGFNNWCIMTDGYTVWITRQKLGEPPTHKIEVPKGIFDRLLTLYEREQKPRR